MENVEGMPPQLRELTEKMVQQATPSIPKQILQLEVERRAEEAVAAAYGNLIEQVARDKKYAEMRVKVFSYEIVQLQNKLAEQERKTVEVPPKEAE